MKSAGIKDYKSFAKEISKKLKNKPISFEVISDDLNVMYNQARKNIKMEIIFMLKYQLPILKEKKHYLSLKNYRT